jgi:hypothetical protein
MLLRVRLALPSLVRVKAAAVLVELRTWLLKVYEVGESVAVGADVLPLLCEAMDDLAVPQPKSIAHIRMQRTAKNQR